MSEGEPKLDDLKKQAETAEAESRIRKARLEETKARLATELELAKEGVERELAVATKRKELVDKLVPKGETKPIEGKVETDEKFGYVAELVAYRVINKLEVELVERLNADDGLRTDARVLIVDRLEHAPDALPLLEVKAQFAQFDRAFEERENGNAELRRRYREESQDEGMALIAPAAVAGIGLTVGTVSGLVGAVADIVGYFRTDYDIKGQDFDVKTEALVAAVAGRLRAYKVKVFLPNFYAIDSSALLEAFAGLQQRAIRLKVSKDLLSSQVVEPADEQIEVLKKQVQASGSEGHTPQEDIEQLRQRLRSLREILDEAKAAIQVSDAILTAFEGFSKSIVTAGTDGQRSKLVQAVLRDRMDALRITHLLWLGNLSSGGEAITKQSLLSSGNTSFLGGTAAAFVLATTDGEVIAADTMVGLGVLDHRFDGGERDKVRYIVL